MPTPLVAPTNMATRPEACPDSLNARFDLRTSLMLTILINSIDWSVGEGQRRALLQCSRCRCRCWSWWFNWFNWFNQEINEEAMTPMQREEIHLLIYSEAWLVGWTAEQQHTSVAWSLSRRLGLRLLVRRPTAYKYWYARGTTASIQAPAATRMLTYNNVKARNLPPMQATASSVNFTCASTSTSPSVAAEGHGIPSSRSTTSSTSWLHGVLQGAVLS